ncbi:caspase family protein [Plantactinospora sp. B24E8]|uniref:caspase, EACC1-associated type n=1 Tax=Plantactinospora sp. B24E8 TaxID=3153567 RepID=UPI00325F8614
MRHALIIATGTYRPPLRDLPGAIADADALAEVLGDDRIGGFAVEVRKDGRAHELRAAIAQLFAHRTRDDVLLLHFSGHGLKDDDGELYLAATDTNPDPEWLRATALPAADVRHAMATTGAGCVIVLVDCCYSGAFPRDGSRGGDPVEIADKLVDKGAAAPGRGRVVLTASTSLAAAFERNGHGVFTQAVVQGLRSGDAARDGDEYVYTEDLWHHVCRVLDQQPRHQQPTYWTHIERRVWIARNPHPRRPTYPAAAPDVPDREPVTSTDPPATPVPAPGWPTRLRPVKGSAVGRLRLLGLRTMDAIPAPLPRGTAAGILTLLALLLGLGAGADAAAPGFVRCVQPAELRVATSAAGYLPYREVADAYELWTAARHDGCPSARLYLYPAAAERVRTGLRLGWAEDDHQNLHHLRDVGPQPDIWLPESPSDLDDLQLGAGSPTLGEPARIAWSPLVLGVPQGRVEPTRDAAHRSMELSWRELFAKATRPDGAGWGVVRADPRSSTTALVATSALYEERTGGIPAFQARQEIEQRLDRSLDAGRYPISDDLALLCRHRALTTAPAGPAAPAVILSEQALIRFNQGRSLGGGCGAGQPPAERNRMLAFYPSDSPLVVQTVVRLHWPNPAQGDRVRAAADHFVRWLSTAPEGKRALLTAGLRPAGYDIGAPVTPANGALTEWPFGLPRDIAGTPRSEQDAARARFAEAHRPGRVLVALDASGSMREPTGSTGRSRFEVALRGLERSLARMGERDEFGLLSFSTTSGDDRVLVPVGRYTSQRAAQVRDTARRIRPAGDTPLYQALRRGAGLLRAGDDEPLRGLVVLTDGEDTSGRPAPTATDLAGVRVYFLALGDVACAGSALDRLADGTGGACLDTTADTVDDRLNQVFESLWKGAR